MFYFNYYDYRPTWPDNLTAHKMLLYEGVMFDSNYCVYRDTLQNSLTTHIKSVSQAVKCSCN